MAHIYSSYSAGSGAIQEKDEAGVSSTLISSDPAMDRRSVMLKYRKSIHVIGTFRRPWVRDRFGAYHKSGVRAPITQPTMVDGTIPGSSEGNMIGYQTFVMKSNNIWMAESNPGPATSTLLSAGLGRLWDGLDWSPADSHVTHARGYVSVDGSIPALAWEMPIGGSGLTVMEAVGTGALGVTLPVRRAVTGYYQVDPFARGVVPYTKYAEEYHDAFFYAGDPNHPERIYYSKLFEPEAVNSTPITVNGRTDDPWLTTTDGDAVTGIQRQGDELIVGTYRGIDAIQGYSYGDYQIRRISNYWGVTSHFSMRRVGPLGSLYFSAPQGPTIYNAGSFRYIGGPIQSWWRDEYRADPTVFDDAFGVEDRYWETYNLLLPQTVAPLSRYVVVDYNSAEFQSPVWVFDLRARKDWVSAELAVDNTSGYYERYTGSCDGNVRQENVDTDADDDGDTYQKKFTIQTPHRFMGDQRGDNAHGRSFDNTDIFIRHETEAAVLSLYGGDDDSPNAATPHKTITSPATGATTGQRARTVSTSERQALMKVSGKGVTLKVEVTAPLIVQYRGWAIDHKEGPAPKEPYR